MAKRAFLPATRWHHWLKMGLIAGLGCLLWACNATPTPIPTPNGGFPTQDPILTEDPATRVPPDAQCAIAYAFHDSLFCLGADGSPLGRDGLPLPIATATTATTNITTLNISPDGKWVAYLLNSPTQQNELWVAARDGSDQHRVASDQMVFTYEWQPNTHRLWFSTQLTTGGTNADLWWVDIDTNETASVLPANSVSSFTFSPTGQALALLQTNGIRWFNLSDATTQAALDFTTPPSAPPTLTWEATGQSLYVALPTAAAQVQFYRLSRESAAEDLGALALDAAAFAQFAPAFSPDGQWAMYATLPQPNQPQLYLRALRTGVETLVAGPGNIRGWGWAPDAQAFAYTQFTPTGVSGVFVARPNLAAEPIAPGFMAVRDLQWLGSDSVVFYGQLTSENWGLYLQRLGHEAKMLVNGLTEEVIIDVR